MWPMARRPTSRHGAPPPERPPAQAPGERAVARAPKGHPMAAARVPVVGRVPREHRAGQPSNPRRPRLVRDVDGGHVHDLFAVFPDLPWPRHAAGNFSRKRTIREQRTAPRALKAGVR